MTTNPHVHRTAPSTEPSVIHPETSRPPVRLLGVWAHPDDEAYLSAGLMARVVAAGGAVTCVTATLGEAGFAADDPRPPGERAELRRRELVDALGVLGVHDVRTFGLPDGGLADIGPSALTALVSDAVADVRPDLIVTFGPDGITGHPDHVAISRATTSVCRRGAAGRLLYATMTDEFLARYAALHERIDLFAEHAPAGIPTSSVALSIELDDAELDRKRSVLAAHHSQTAGLAEVIGEAEFRRWWASETFRRPTGADLADAMAHAEPRAVATAPVLVSRSLHEIAR